MCNRYRRSTRLDGFQALKRALSDVEPPLEIFPKRDSYIVRRDGSERVVDVANWGFPFAKATGGVVTNIRNLQSGMWRNALANPAQRCLVPVEEFCEWSGEKGSKVAHWFSVVGQNDFAFAGVWRPLDEDRKAFAFLTTGYLGDPTTHIVGAIHAKAMPVILLESDYDRWLDGEDAEAMATCFPSQMMTMR